jgi:hypothetical protein
LRVPNRIGVGDVPGLNSGYRQPADCLREAESERPEVSHQLIVRAGQVDVIAAGQRGEWSGGAQDGARHQWRIHHNVAAGDNWAGSVERLTANHRVLIESERETKNKKKAFTNS